jgi:hypothetical protein
MPVGPSMQILLLRLDIPDQAIPERSSVLATVAHACRDLSRLHRDLTRCILFVPWTRSPAYSKPAVQANHGRTIG